MNLEPLTQVLLRINPKAEEAVAAAFESVIGLPATAYHDARTGVVSVSVYASESRGKLALRVSLLRHRLRELNACGLDWGDAKLRVRRVRRQNWAESWKRHFKPLDVSGRLLVKPSWSRRRARRGQAAVILDPGLSFGTGQHATTRFCLQQLVVLRREGGRQSFLDIGTGSGILAIAAAKLGYSDVRAFDLDAEAVRVARRNCAGNNVEHQVHLSQWDVLRLPTRSMRKLDVICANLTYDLLLEARIRVVACLADRGALVLAGILRTQFPRVCRAYAALGLKLKAQRTEKEWKSGAFCRAS